MFTDLVLIGRFQPLHNEHLRVIEAALAQTEHLVIVLGSCNVPMTAKNPFTPGERTNMICAAVSQPEKLSFVWSDDFPYDWVRWETEIINTVHNAVLDRLNEGLHVRLHGLDQRNIGLLCPHKDKDTSEYLNLFECWEHVDVPVASPMNATDVRNHLFFSSGKLPEMVPPAVVEFLDRCDTKTMQYLKAEHNYISNYKKMWASAPFPPMFITVDNAVFHRDRVLLITRGGQPGNGLWALPGGHHEVGQTLWNSALRELQEETTLEGVEKYFRYTDTFDNPSRSQLGAMVTHAFYFVIPDEVDVPLVKGEDDAEYAEWVPLEDIIPEMMHDDHFWILERFCQAGHLGTPKIG